MGVSGTKKGMHGRSRGYTSSTYLLVTAGVPLSVCVCVCVVCLGSASECETAHFYGFQDHGKDCHIRRFKTKLEVVELGTQHGAVLPHNGGAGKGVRKAFVGFVGFICWIHYLSSWRHAN